MKTVKKVVAKRKLSEDELVQLIAEIAQEEGFTPMGLHDYCEDIIKNPEIYGEGWKPEFLSKYNDIGLRDISLTLARKASCLFRNQTNSKSKIHGFKPSQIVSYLSTEGWNYRQIKHLLQVKGFVFEKAQVLEAMEKVCEVVLTDEQVNDLYENFEK